jgi:hypothetical protein
MLVARKMHNAGHQRITEVRRMINVNPENVRFIIDKAREFHAKEEVSFPEPPLSPADDWALQALADHQDDLSLLEVKAAIDDLEPDQQIEVVALMWLGRGDFALEEWDDAVEQARSAYNARTAEYLMSTPLVADYLEEALNVQGYENE